MTDIVTVPYFFLEVTSQDVSFIEERDVTFPSEETVSSRGDVKNIQSQK